MQHFRPLQTALLTLAVMPAAFAQQPPAQPPVQIPVPSPQQPDSGVITPGVVTLYANARAVLLDVVVTDGHGHPVHNLKPGDFHIFEDGQPQTVSSLEEHHAPTSTDPASQPKLPALGPNTFTNRRPPASDQATTVFLLDALDSPVQAQMYARQQLLSWIDSMPTGAQSLGNQVAIFQLDTELHLIQGFTSDPTVLKAALKERSKPMLTAVPRGGGYTTAAVQMDFLTHAMQSIGAYLQTRPGRKNLVWFTAHIPRYTYDDGTYVGGALHDSQGFLFDYSKATDALVLGEVSVYPIDTRGLQTDPAFSAANGRGASARSSTAFSTRQFFQHTDLDEVAEATGGKAFYNTNGIKQVVNEVLDSGSDYYTLSFYPTNKKWDGRYRKLKVETETPGLQLQYRRGYYAQTEVAARPRPGPPRAPAPDPQGRVQLTHSTPNPDQAAFLAAMHLGAIDPNQIVFTSRVDVDPAVDKIGKKEPLPKNNFLDPKYKDRPFRVFKVFSRLSGGQLQLTPQPNGTRHGSVECIAFVLDDQGAIVNSLITSVDMDLTPASYAQAIASGVELLSPIAVPEKGTYFLRVGVHDKSSGRAGALEFSTSDVKIAPPTP